MSVHITHMRQYMIIGQEMAQSVTLESPGVSSLIVPLSSPYEADLVARACVSRMDVCAHETTKYIIFPVSYSRYTRRRIVLPRENGNRTILESITN